MNLTDPMMISQTSDIVNYHHMKIHIETYISNTIHVSADV